MTEQKQETSSTGRKTSDAPEDRLGYYKSAKDHFQQRHKQLVDQLAAGKDVYRKARETAKQYAGDAVPAEVTDTIQKYVNLLLATLKLDKEAFNSLSYLSSKSSEATGWTDYKEAIWIWIEEDVDAIEEDTRLYKKEGKHDSQDDYWDTLMALDEVIRKDQGTAPPGQPIHPVDQMASNTRAISTRLKDILKRYGWH